MKVMITGSASHLANVVLPLLCNDTRISQVVGVDLKPANFRNAKYQHHQLDVRSIDLKALMQSCDAVIHMAFVVMPGSLNKLRFDRQLIRDINLNGSKNVFQLVRACRVPLLIHLSSAVVYGAWRENPPLIDERQTLRAMDGFAYAEDKVAVEKLLDEYEKQDNSPRVIRLRPHVILGPQAQPLLLRLLRQPFYPRFPDPQPLTQCVWEDDVAQAILLAIFSTVQGSYNLATQPPMSFKQMIQYNHRLALPVNYELVKKLHRWIWKFSSLAGDPAWSEGMAYSLAINSSKAETDLGWKPKKNSYECLRAMSNRRHIKT